MGNRNYRRTVLSVLLVFGLVFAFGGVSLAATLTVGPGDSYDYKSIQDAVDNADSGDTIEVYAGTYVEDINIPMDKNNLVLHSVSGAEVTEIQGDTAERVIFVNSLLGITIEGFKITPGSSAHTGIYFDPDGGSPLDPVTITGNVMEGFSQWNGYGLNAMWDNMEGTLFTFTGNTVRDCTRGVYVHGFKNCEIDISCNLFEDCSDYSLLAEHFDNGGDGTDARINNNQVTLSSGNSGDTGISVSNPEATTEIVGNRIEGDFGTGMYIEHIGGYGQSPAIVTIEKNEIRGTGTGLFFRDPAHNMPSEVTVRYNSIENNEYGIYVQDLTYEIDTVIQFTDNNLSGNSLYGFFNDVDGTWLDAQGNWWGDDTGPYHPTTNPSGQGNDVSDYVDYGSWRTTPWEEEDDSSSGCNAGAMSPLFMLVLAPLGLLLRKSR